MMFYVSSLVVSFVCLLEQRSHELHFYLFYAVGSDLLGQ